jgi:hypothetical protein
MLVTADKAVVLRADKGHQLEVHNMDDTKEFSFTHEDWHDVGQKAQAWAVPLIVVLALAALLLGQFVAAFLSGVAVKILGAIMGPGLMFGDALRVAAAARMPVNFILMIPLVAGGSQIGGVTGWIVWGGYMVFATASCKLQAA